MEHELKILPKYFEAVLEEVKTFELRKDDRNFQVGEGIDLKEFDGEKYTRREVPVEIVYKLDGGKFGLEQGYCILGIKIRWNKTLKKRSKGDDELKLYRVDLIDDIENYTEIVVAKSIKDAESKVANMDCWSCLMSVIATEIDNVDGFKIKVDINS